MSHAAYRYVDDVDYSDSECPSDAQMMHQGDVTELYRRKQAQARKLAGNCYHNTPQWVYL